MDGFTEGSPGHYIMETFTHELASYKTDFCSDVASHVTQALSEPKGSSQLTVPCGHLVTQLRKATGSLEVEVTGVGNSFHPSARL